MSPKEIRSWRCACVEIVIGTVNEEDTVEVETKSGTATGLLD